MKAATSTLALSPSSPADVERVIVELESFPPEHWYAELIVRSRVHVAAAEQIAREVMEGDRKNHEVALKALRVAADVHAKTLRVGVELGILRPMRPGINVSVFADPSAFFEKVQQDFTALQEMMGTGNVHLLDVDAPTRVAARPSGVVERKPARRLRTAQNV